MLDQRHLDKNSFEFKCPLLFFIVLSLGGSYYTDYFFNTSHCSITKLNLYPMWMLRRISQDSGDNTVCCNPFFLILLFNYSYMHPSVNVSSFTGIRHTSLVIKDVKIFSLFCVSYIDTIWRDLDKDIFCCLFAVRLSLIPLNCSSAYSNFSTICNNIGRAIFGAFKVLILEP
jgi:hypothetical protein